MAWWKERGKGRNVFVYYMGDDGQQKTIGRAKSRVLDALTRDQRDEWVRRWELLNEAYKHRPDLTAIPHGAKSCGPSSKVD